MNNNVSKGKTTTRSTTRKKVTKGSVKPKIDLEKLYDTGVVELPRKKGVKNI